METKIQNYGIKIFNTLNESQKRWYAAQKAIEIGYGGITKVKALTSMSRTTIQRALKFNKKNPKWNYTIKIKFFV